MDAGSEAVGDLRCPERGFSAPSNQTAPSDQAADAPGDAFRALPVNGGGSVAVANAADAADTVALVEHGMCGGFSWLCTAAGQAFRNALVRHGAKAGFAGAAWRWLLFGTDADRPPGQAAGRGDRAQGWFATLFANMRPSRIAGAMWILDVDAGTHALSTDADAAWPQRGAQLAPTPEGKRIVQLCILAYYTSAGYKQRAARGAKAAAAKVEGGGVEGEGAQG